MPNMNMSPSDNKDTTTVVSEFQLPVSEIDAQLKVGERGKLVLPVEVVAVTDGSITFRKIKSATIEGGFRPETLDDMKLRIQDQQEEDTDEDGE